MQKLRKLIKEKLEIVRKNEATTQMRNYIKFPLVKALVRENPLKKLKIVKIYRFCGEILQ